MYNNSTVIGNVGETLALSEFSRRGITVLIPFGQNVPYDLAIEINGILYRIQCKTTEKVHDNCKMRFNICRTNGFTGQHKPYSKDEIDFLFVHCIENGYIGLVPIEETNNQREIVIRTSPSKNKQKNGIRMMEDYELDFRLGTLGQLVRPPAS